MAFKAWVKPNGRFRTNIPTVSICSRGRLHLSAGAMADFEISPGDLFRLWFDPSPAPGTIALEGCNLDSDGMRVRKSGEMAIAEFLFDNGVPVEETTRYPLYQETIDLGGEHTAVLVFRLSEGECSARPRSIS